jgi:hypothetical protein
MATTETCQHATLARNGVASVQRCTHCHCISVNLGPATVRLDEESLEALWSVLGEAAAALHARRRASMPAPRAVA